MIVQGNIKTHWIEVYQGISVIQHFHRGELNYVICIMKVEIRTFFNDEWFFRPDINRGALRGGFSWRTETGH